MVQIINTYVHPKKEDTAVLRKGETVRNRKGNTHKKRKENVTR